MTTNKLDTILNDVIEQASNSDWAATDYKGIHQEAKQVIEAYIAERVERAKREGIQEYQEVLEQTGQTSEGVWYALAAWARNDSITEAMKYMAPAEAYKTRLAALKSNER